MVHFLVYQNFRKLQLETRDFQGTGKIFSGVGESPRGAAARLEWDQMPITHSAVGNAHGAVRCVCRILA